MIDQKDGSIVHSKVKALMISLPLTSPEKKATSQSKGGLISEVILTFVSFKKGCTANDYRQTTDKLIFKHVISTLR